MKTILSPSFDPAINLALEETLLNEGAHAEEILFFFIDEPSIIVGRHQNTIEEINTAYVDTHHIHVVRRLSGGGAVYHDHGNLNFSFIKPGESSRQPDFAQFTAPVVRALNQMGAPVQLNGRNDLTLNGQKVSGNAYYHTRSGCVCHGTLLFDSDLSVLGQALLPKNGVTQSKAVASVRSRVTNLKPCLSAISDMGEFRQCLIQKLNANGEAKLSKTQVSAATLAAAQTLAELRYRTWEWNYGKSPLYNLRRVRHFSFGTVDLRVQLEKGIIRSCHISGDFFCNADPDQLTTALSGVTFERHAIQAALEQAALADSFPGSSVEEWLDFLSANS